MCNILCFAQNVKLFDEIDRLCVWTQNKTYKYMYTRNSLCRDRLSRYTGYLEIKCRSWQFSLFILQKKDMINRDRISRKTGNVDVKFWSDD